MYVYSENHVRGHVLLCMLAYYLEWHLRKALAPLLFEDDDREGAARNARVQWEKRKYPTARRRKAARKRHGKGSACTVSGLSWKIWPR